MRQNLRKFTAGVLSATLIMSTTVLAFAADNASAGNISGSGEVEGTLPTDVYEVELPTIAVDDTTFNYILDPEGLIDKTGNAKYENKTFEANANLFFANIAVGATNDYSSTSDALTVVNKSTMDVDITLEATISAIEGISMTSDKTFAGNTAPSIYMALTDGTSTQAIDAVKGASITAKIDAAPEAAYEYSYTEGIGYEFKIKDDLTGITFDEYSFSLTGACNSNANWNDLADAAPVVDVTWTVVEHIEQIPPTISQTTYTMTAGTAIVVSTDLGAGDLAATGITSVTFKTASNAIKVIPATDYTFRNGVLTFTAAHIDSLLTAGVTSRICTITFNDAAKTKIDVTLSKS